MNPTKILQASPCDIIKETSSFEIPTDIATDELKKQKSITRTTKERLCHSVKGAIGELDKIVSELSIQAKLGSDVSCVNSMLYDSLLMLIDELDYIASYIQKIEHSIDLACFDVAKKLNEAIVHLIGHRKDILFKIIETTYKINDYIIK